MACLRKESVGHVRMSFDEGMTGLVAQTERPLFTSRADEHPRFKYFPETGEEMFRSFGGVPTPYSIVWRTASAPLAVARAVKRAFARR